LRTSSIYFAFIVLCLLLINVIVIGQNYNITPVNGNTKFNYNQIPENLVSVSAGITGVTFQWQKGPAPQDTFGDGFINIGGAVNETYSFPGSLSQSTFYRRVQTEGNGKKFYSNVIKIQVVSINWENINYVREHDVLIAGQTDWKTIDQLPIGSKLQTTTYMDGLGRPIQKVSRETALQDPALPNNLWGDMVQFTNFDAFGRQDKQYLPYSTISQSGKYKTTTSTAQPQYYTTNYAESAPYSRVAIYDNSPLNRPLKVNESGTNFTNSAGSQVAYDLNDVNDLVQNFSIGNNFADLPLSLGAFIAKTLFKTTTTDENGKKVIEFTNQSGQLILKKVQLDDAPASVYTGWICTYNVYDDFGQLRFTIQPEAVKWLVGNGWNFSVANGQTVADEWCFRYEYDAKGRTIKKKAPGAKELIMLYDSRDRVVFMQDGNQRNPLLKPTPEWTANLYDELDRPVLTTLYSTVKTTSGLQTDIDNSVTVSSITIVNNGGGTQSNLIVNNRQTSITRYAATNSIEFVADAGGNFESVANDNFIAEIDPAAVAATTTVTTAVYGSPIVPATDFTNPAKSNILKYFFYDNYSYATAKPFSTGFDNAQAYATSDPIAKTNRTINMPTGTMVKILGTNTFLTSTFYYDEKGRAIQSSEENIKGGTDVTTNQYEFDGRLLSTATKHTTANSGYTNYGIITKNIFDKIGRVISIQKKYGSNAFKTIGTYDMDDMGRLKTKHLDPGYTNPTSTKAEMESLKYSYNLHNQLTGINKDYALKTPGAYTLWGNYFGLCLGYDKTESIFAGTSLNGQVSGILWNSQGDNIQRKFDFTYDAAGRLTKADFNERRLTTAAWNKTIMDFSTSSYTGKIEYDLNGNLLAMSQKGVVSGNNTPVTVDDLRYTYSSFSNKLTKVSDLGNLGINNGKLGDFADGANGGDDYVYDDNGNLIIDLNKTATNVTAGVTTAIGVSGIKYNFLDKPEEIKITGKGTIKMVYDADGNKLQKVFIPNTGSAIVTTYVNQFIYEEVTAFVTTSTAAPFGSAGTLQYINFEEGRLRVMQSVAQTNGFDFLNINGTADMPESPLGGQGGFRGAWDFFVRDYQGNVRMILTEETHNGGNSCTMETARAANEEPVFGQVDISGVPTAANEVKARFATPPGWTNNTSAYVARVGNLAAKKVGPNVLLKVMAGDEISVSADYYYQNAVTNTSGGPSLIGDLLTSLVNAISGSSSTSSIIKGNVGSINTQLTGNVTFNSLNEPDYNNATGSAPKAYLTMVFFDERFNVVTDLTSTKRVSQAGPNAAALTTPFQKAARNGYCMVYVSNQSDEMVYFDNLQVSNKHGRIIEENHYYAYGLKIAGLSSKKMQDPAEGHLTNKNLYNDKELIDDADLNWYDYGFRSYDAQIGRFTQLDPLTHSFPELTPFQYAGCEPIANVDLDGLEPLMANVTVTAAYSNKSSPSGGRALFLNTLFEYLIPLFNYISADGSASFASKKDLGPTSSFAGHPYTFSGITQQVNTGDFSDYLKHVDIPESPPSYFRPAEYNPNIIQQWDDMNNSGLPIPNQASSKAVYDILDQVVTFGSSIKNGWRDTRNMRGDNLISRYGAASAERMRVGAAIGTLSLMTPVNFEGVAAKGGAEGGLNLFKFGSKEATSSAGWKSGDRFLKMFDQGSPKLNWKQNSGFLRSEMNLGKPIFDSYRLPNGNLIPTGGFLNAERNLLQSRGWLYNSGQGAWLPPIR
jgi:RHS repeat-associated protein